MTELVFYQPPIALPKGIQAFVTTRNGGYSQGPWLSFNLGEHVKDDPAAVAANRVLLKQQLLSATGSTSLDLQWLNQVHGTTVHQAHGPSTTPPTEADALYTTATNLVCGVLTADCLPMLFCSSDGQEIAVAHAGWRGLQKGVLENTIACFKAPPAQIIAWMGPAIGPCHFEVGDEVREAFLESAQETIVAETTTAIENAFLPSVNHGKWFADLYQLARIRLLNAGLSRISGEPICTVCENTSWYSYRHSPVTGRFATLIVKTS